MYQDIGEEAIAKHVYDRFPDLSSYINMHGLRKLARRALSRGYEEDLIIYGLDTVIKKNYKRKEYHGDDALDERRFISDAEFRAIMKGEDETKILWC